MNIDSGALISAGPSDLEGSWLVSQPSLCGIGMFSRCVLLLPPLSNGTMHVHTCYMFGSIRDSRVLLSVSERLNDACAQQQTGCFCPGFLPAFTLYMLEMGTRRPSGHHWIDQK